MMILHSLGAPIDLDQSRSRNSRRRHAAGLRHRAPPIRGCCGAKSHYLRQAVRLRSARKWRAGRFVGAACARVSGHPETAAMAGDCGRFDAYQYRQDAKSADGLRESWSQTMGSDFPRDWMWSEACAMLARAEGLHRELFRPIGRSASPPAWEPPVDVLETDHEVLVLVALPGVNPDRVEAAIDGNDLVVAGTRVFPGELRTA